MNDSEPQTYDPFKHRCIGTQYKFTLWPRTCHLTGKTLWLKNVYKQTAMITGPGDPVFEYRWYDRNEFLTARLKGEV
jgi:hypothetical protein